jgi:hypothetical protein
MEIKKADTRSGQRQPQGAQGRTKCGAFSTEIGQRTAGTPLSEVPAALSSVDRCIAPLQSCTAMQLFCARMQVISTPVQLICGAAQRSCAPLQIATDPWPARPSDKPLKARNQAADA